MKPIEILLLACRAVVISIAAAMFVPGASAAAPQFKVLYNFRLSKDGGFPGAGVIADGAGNLYGTTEGGGRAYSTVYELKRPVAPGGTWTEITLHSFKDSRDGLYPQAGLVFDAMGNLYGTAPNGGSNACIGGCGTVFRLAPPAVRGGPWTFSVLYRFQGGRDGYRPYDGSLLLDGTGKIFGTTVVGGTSTQCSGFGCGTVFELTPPARSGGVWSEKVIHRFGSGIDGATPFNGLIFDRRGNLYGTARSGGSFANGVVFKLVPPASRGAAWSEDILYHFGSKAFDGLLPTCKLAFHDGGRLYGTTQSGGNGCTGGGCGTVFRLTPPADGHGAWTEDLLFSFHNVDGEEPDAGVIFDRAGNIYGTTYIGGFNGTVFRLTPQGGTWVETTLHQFTGADDGQGPVGDLIGRGRSIFGVAHAGGVSGSGTVFEVVP